MSTVSRWHTRKIAAVIIYSSSAKTQKKAVSKKVWTKPVVSKNSSLGSSDTTIHPSALDKRCLSLQKLFPYDFYLCILVSVRPI